MAFEIPVETQPPPEAECTAPTLAPEQQSRWRMALAITLLRHLDELAKDMQDAE